MAGPIQTTLINKWLPMVGYNHVFPAGTQALIARRVDDSKKGTSVYQGIIFHDLTNTCLEVTFDVTTLKHVLHDENNPHCPYDVSITNPECA